MRKFPKEQSKKGKKKRDKKAFRKSVKVVQWLIDILEKQADKRKEKNDHQMAEGKCNRIERHELHLLSAQHLTEM